MYRSGKVKVFVLLVLSLLTAGCLADATPGETTYKSQYTDFNIVFNGDGEIENIHENTYVWSSPDGKTSGNWYKDGNVIYLQMGFCGDLPLTLNGSSLTWPNGSVWVKV